MCLAIVCDTNQSVNPWLMLLAALQIRELPHEATPPGESWRFII